jgi:hypothetical protein
LLARYYVFISLAIMSLYKTALLRKSRVFRPF